MIVNHYHFYGRGSKAYKEILFLFQTLKYLIYCGLTNTKMIDSPDLDLFHLEMTILSFSKSFIKTPGGIKNLV
jgi:hypothetical protein